MKNSIKVFKNEVSKTIKNPIALIIIIAICVLPSLYAWVNIAASWDPYLKTSSIPVVVVNNDEGCDFNGETINVGAQVVDQLKQNDSIDWQFDNEKQANLGLYDGTYYALIEIDEDFSKDLTSLLSEDPIKPTIIYKIDNKENPVISKITTIAQETVVAQIKTNFLKTVNETAFESLNGVGATLEQNRSEILALKDIIIQVDRNYDTIIGLLESNEAHAGNFNNLLATNGLLLESMNDLIGNYQDNFDQDNGSSNGVLPLVENNLDAIEVQLEAMIVELRLDADQISAGKTQSIEEMNTKVETINTIIDGLDNYLEAVNVTDSEIIDNYRDSLAKIQQYLDQLSNSIQDHNSDYSNIEESLRALASDLSQVKERLEKEIAPVIQTLAISYDQIGANVENTLANSSDTITSLIGINDNLMAASDLNQDVSASLVGELEYYHDMIHNLALELESVDDDDLALITAILQSDPNLMGEYLANPFTIENEAIFPIANYGSGMTPIYTVLAIWVGAIILTSILSPKAARFAGDEMINVRQRYIGKLLYYLLLGFFQGLIMVLGNKFILGVQTANPGLFVIFGIITALTFTTIVYTNVALLGPVGKALNIALLVFQLVGSGGSYPIQVDALALRMVQPFFPFTYALSGFREAIGGVVASQVIVDLTVLGAYVVLSLVIGIVFYGRIHHQVDKLHHHLEDTGLIE